MVEILFLKKWMFSYQKKHKTLCSCTASFNRASHGTSQS